MNRFGTELYGNLDIANHPRTDSYGHLNATYDRRRLHVDYVQAPSYIVACK